VGWGLVDVATPFVPADPVAALMECPRHIQKNFNIHNESGRSSGGVYYIAVEKFVLISEANSAILA
jgi:hypothetical protein